MLSEDHDEAQRARMCMPPKRDDAILVGQSIGKTTYTPGTPYIEGSLVWVAPDKAYAMVSPEFMKALRTPRKRAAKRKAKHKRD